MIRYTDIENMRQREDWAGYGYLGSHFRTHKSDQALAAAANSLGLSIEQVFAYVNSKAGRWAAEGGVNTSEGFVRELTDPTVAALLQE